MPDISPMANSDGVAIQESDDFKEIEKSGTKTVRNKSEIRKNSQEENS